VKKIMHENTVMLQIRSALLIPSSTATAAPAAAAEMEGSNETVSNC